MARKRGRNDMNEMIRSGAGRGPKPAAEAPEVGKGRGGRGAAAAAEGVTLEEVDQMSLEELDEALPEAEKVAEATAAELDEVQGRREDALGVVAAMNARAAALEGQGS